MSSSRPESYIPRVLIVDDDPLLCEIVAVYLAAMGLHTMQVNGGEDGLTALEQALEANNPYDVLVLDRDMPVLGGLELVKRLKRNVRLKNMPVIMLTGAKNPEQVSEGIAAGVFYYLTKPVDFTVLNSVVTSALDTARRQRILQSELKRHRQSFTLMRNASFSVRKLEDAEGLAAFLANAFPDPDRAVGGLAELLVNAVEHGIFQLGFETKARLLAEGQWQQELAQRMTLSEFANKDVDVTFRKDAEGCRVVITDPGSGFDWKAYRDLDPSRAHTLNGRGIAQAILMSFDKVEYNNAGNQVTAFMDTRGTLTW